MPFTIIGVTPEWFKGTLGVPIVPQFYVPWNGPGALRPPSGGHLIGRLNPGVTRDHAQADLSRIAAQLSREHKDRRTRTINVYPATQFAPTVFGPMAMFAVLFMAVVGLVLLIACDNIAILLLARSAARRRTEVSDLV